MMNQQHIFSNYLTRYNYPFHLEILLFALKDAEIETDTTARAGSFQLPWRMRKGDCLHAQLAGTETSNLTIIDRLLIEISTRLSEDWRNACKCRPEVVMITKPYGASVSPSFEL